MPLGADTIPLAAQTPSISPYHRQVAIRIARLVIIGVAGLGLLAELVPR